MAMGRVPYEELTDKKNERILGTFTHRGWARISMAQARALYIEVVGGAEDLDDLVDRIHAFDTENGRLVPFEQVLHFALQSSGSIGGRHREDLRDAVQGMRPGKAGLVLQTATEAPGVDG